MEHLSCPSQALRHSGHSLLGPVLGRSAGRLDLEVAEQMDTPQSSTFIGISCDFSIKNLIPGWWLQTMEFDNLIFPCRFFGMSSETHWLSLHHFSRWARESTTNQIHFGVSVRCRRPCRRPRRLDSWDYKNLHGWVILDKGKCWCAYSSIMGCIWVYQD